MSEVDREPARPVDEPETPRGSPSYAVTLAALNAALAEPLPPADATAAPALSTVEG